MTTAPTTKAETATLPAQPVEPSPAKGSKSKAAQPKEKASAAAPAKAVKAAKKAPASAPAADKDAKSRKPKLVRDSFTIPKDEYAVIEDLKQRTAKLSQPAKKSELLRAGLKLLAKLDEAALAQAMQDVPSIKTGRPKADKK